jgi:acyl-CoA synthetase (AMP-forming)/AMP-acid ligase II
MNPTLRQLIAAAGNLPQRWIHQIDHSIPLGRVLRGSFLDVPAERLRGRSVLIATEEAFAAALALIVCDGLARRIVLCPPGVSPEQLRSIAEIAEIDAVLCDNLAAANPVSMRETFTIGRSATDPSDVDGNSPVEEDETAPEGSATEWILLTSGTSGPPKLAVHTLATLTGAMQRDGLGDGAVWGTFYDIRRYGGLQIFLRAMTCGGSIVLPGATEAVPAFLERAGRHCVSHMSGTPSHWRRALMARHGDGFAPRYVRLSGELADQAILDRLRATFHNAAVSHAFASTEAGLAFDVNDGLAGFPADLVGNATGVQMRVEEGSLRIRSDRTALRYLGDGVAELHAADGFVDTGDMVELRNGRYHFVGRRSGIINVGGLKIHPEEVEAVIAGHPRVRMCVVKARRNAITGAIVVADVVAEFADAAPARADAEHLEAEIFEHCGRHLPRYKVPVSIRFLPALDISVSGKLGR